MSKKNEVGEKSEGKNDARRSRELRAELNQAIKDLEELRSKSAGLLVGQPVIVTDYPYRLLSEVNLGEGVAAANINRHLLTRTQVSEVHSELSRLRAELDQKAQTLFKRDIDAKQKESLIRELKEANRVYQEKESLAHLLNRVGEPAQQKLLTSPEFRALFDRDSPCPAYVLSIDIRRSTELMLKAREPKLYATFITDLARKLRDVILGNYGVFDKFTGDGILAFFPEFYSGGDAGYYAVKSANDCHEVFADHYEANKRCFTSILKDIGLGIGLDYGQVQIVQIGGDFTVVGTPVVYACRMGGAKAGQTYINQPAYEQLFERYSAISDYEDCEIEIKHEGRTAAYSVELNGKDYTPALPEWNKPAGTPTESNEKDGE